MALASGTNLGPYEILSPLGAGGMGEVYRARDTRLDRVVAVKILPAHLSSDAEAKQRFEREARTISSLNHPSICVLHDVGTQDGMSYLVMEYLQGESLEARLLKGALPLKQALECGVQVCDALEKAHRAGIVHRDLKPGNIMLTPGGAKLLDFGLAKPAAILGGMGSSSPLTPSTPTMNLTALSKPAGTLTQQGMVVGTFQYMAPEVLQGQEADARSDIFSFGAVLYEMVTGRRAFEGKSQISVASSILEKEPEPVTRTQPTAPPALDHVLQGCLAKDPGSRWQDAADVARGLRWVSTGGSAVAPALPLRRRNRLAAYLPWALALIILLVGIFVVQRESEPGRTLRSYLPPPSGMGFDFTGDFSGPPVITTDGTAIAFCAHGPNERDSIWVQPLNALAPRKLEGTEGASFPFWSADAKFLGFFAEGRLKKIPAAGGPITILADAPNARGGSWNQDNVIIYEPDYRDTIWRINAGGGTPTRLTQLEAGRQTTHRWPRFLPDGKHFLFFATSHSGGSEQGVYLGSLDDGSYRLITSADSDAQYASGYLLYHVQSELLAQKFNASSGKLSGDPVSIASFVEYDTGTWHTTFAVSQTGLLVYEQGSKTLGTDLVWRDAGGKLIGKGGERGFYKGSGRISPDGKRLVVSMGDPEADIWVFDIGRGTQTRLTFGGATHLMPTWSPDGQKVTYVQQNGATIVSGTSLRARLANGGGQEELLIAADTDKSPVTLLHPQWSSDGRYLLHLEQSGPTGAGIWALPTGEKRPIPIVQPPSPQSRIVQFRLSPDGRWLAYSSTESGREEVYVTHFPSVEGRWQVSQNGGTFPLWRGDSKEMYYIGLDGFVHVAAVNPKSQEFELDKVRSIFPVGYTSPIGFPYDVSADGKKFLFATPPEGVSTPLVLVTNWTSELTK